jgi:hypothetical protein
MQVSPKSIKEKITLLNKITSKSVFKCTGKNWDQWIKILDNAGAKNLSHKNIVIYLADTHKLSLWWQQLVTSSYEVHIGRRIEGQNHKGEYATALSKTMPLNQKKMWKFICSPEGQKIWLKPLSPLKILLKEQYEAEGGIFGEIRTMKAPERIRLTWQDSDWEKSTVVQVMCIPRPKEKSIFVVQHEKLKNLRLKKQLLQHWKQVFEELHKAISEL